MCDYSLHLIASRPAKVADRLVSTDFVKSITRGFTEIGGNEPVRDLRWPRGDEMQTIVAHGKGTPVKGRIPALFLLNPALDQ